MDGLFTWIIVIGAIFSIFSKASGKNAQKPGAGKTTNDTMKQITDAYYKLGMITKQQQPPIQNSAQRESAKQNPSIWKLAVKAPERALTQAIVNTPMSVWAESPNQEGMMAPGTVIPQDANYGEGFADAEGTSFGDGTKGTEGECDEEHGKMAYQQEAAFDVQQDEVTKWNFNNENLMSAFVYSEILHQPKCRRREIR